MAWWMAIPAMLQAGSAIAGGINENKAAKFEADQIRHQAKADFATSSMEAAELARQGRLERSTAIARLAAGGGSLSDVTSVNLLADLDADTEYRVLSQLYEGKTAYRSGMTAAKVRRFEGKMAERAGYIKAATGIGTAYSDYKTFNAKYGSTS